MRLWDRFDDDEFVEDVARKLAWTAGGPAIPARFFRDFVDRLLVENRLIRGELRVNGQPVDLEAIVAPLLALIGRDDAFVPPEATTPVLDAAGSDDVELLKVPTGHVGLSTAPEAHEREDGWPRVREWFVARDH